MAAMVHCVFLVQVGIVGIFLLYLIAYPFNLLCFNRYRRLKAVLNCKSRQVRNLGMCFYCQGEGCQNWTDHQFVETTCSQSKSPSRIASGKSNVIWAISYNYPCYCLAGVSSCNWSPSDERLSIFCIWSMFWYTNPYQLLLEREMEGKTRIFWGKTILRISWRGEIRSLISKYLP